MDDPNRFTEPALGFELHKPDSWEFVTAAWMPSAEPRDAQDSWAWIKANQPFCVARKLHQSTHHAFPTLQVTARALQVPTEAQARALLQMQEGILQKHYGQFEVRESRADFRVDGHRTLVLRGSFCLNTSIEGEYVPVWMLSRLFVIFAPGRAFTVGMSSSLDAGYYLESEFEQILGSIRIASD
jgi:hypothetical protein